MKEKINETKLDVIQSSKENLQKARVIMDEEKNEFLKSFSPDHSDLDQRMRPIASNHMRLRKERRN